VTRVPDPTRKLSRNLALVFFAIAAALAIPHAKASTGLCDVGTQCAAEQTIAEPGKQLAELTSALATANMGYAAPQRHELSDQEFFSFSGVGALVCTVNGSPRVATAFLVGAFDLGVTVAHPFEENGVWAQPENCVYTSTDSTGQVRERIAVASLKTEWQLEAGAYGRTAKDFAVVRLQHPSEFAQRTMPLGRFSGNAASVLMIGFSELDADTLKRKTQGTVYARNSETLANPSGFTHDMDSRGIASGAPVVDEKSGVIIGVHTQVSAADRGTTRVERNTMIIMNEWLEKALRAEMETAATAANTSGK
jgi:V8-like Glu-specific endopeptidase